MKFNEGDKVIVNKNAYGVYPTAGHKATVLGFSKEKDKYLLDFKDYIGGHICHMGDKLTKVGYGLYVAGKIISKDYGQEKDI